MSTAEPAQPSKRMHQRGADASIPLPVQRAFAAGRTRYGDLPLALDRFAARVLAATRKRLAASGIPAAGADLEQALDKLAGADLFLAIACDEDIPGAWQAFAAHIVPGVRRMAQRRGAGDAEAEELARELPGELCMAPPEGETRTRLGTFDGTGSLLAWLGVVVRRRLADRRRGAGARTATLADATPLGAAERSKSDDPLVLVSDGEARAALEQGLRAAWEGMTARERIAVDLRFRRGLAQKEIARMLAVGEPRVSRILDAAVARLRREVGRRLDLTARRQWDLGRLWQAVAQVLDENRRQEHRQEQPTRSDPEGVQTHA